MLLFSRIVTLVGSPRKVMPWVADITSYVNANSDLQTACWTSNFGYPLGTIAWSAIVESQAALAASTSSLLTQDGYLDRLEAAADLVPTPGQDVLRQLVHGTPSDPPPLGAVANITAATAVADRMADAVGWSIEIAQHASETIGSPVAFFTDVFGTMGGVAWIAVAADAAAADAAQAALAADAGYLKRITGSKDLFIPGSGHVSQVTRIA